MQRQKAFLGSVCVSLLVSTAAVAADFPIPVKASPPSVLAWSWTGLYIGVHGGFGGDQFAYPIAAPVVPLSAEASLNSSGFFGGAQIGYNYQIAPSWVVGIEADIAASGIEGKLSAVVTAPIALSASAGSELEWFGTVRGRVGYLINPSTLVYGTGGFAFGSTKSLVTLGPLSASVTNDKTGWAAGGGVEYAVNQWLSFKAEYLYLDLGTSNLLSIGGGALTIDEKTTVHTIKAGLNLKLGSF